MISVLADRQTQVVDTLVGSENTNARRRVQVLVAGKRETRRLVDSEFFIRRYIVLLHNVELLLCVG